MDLVARSVEDMSLRGRGAIGGVEALERRGNIAADQKEKELRIKVGGDQALQCRRGGD